MTQQEENSLEVQELEPTAPPVEAELPQLQDADKLRERLDAAIAGQADDATTAAYTAFVADYLAETGASEEAVLAGLAKLAHGPRSGGRSGRPERAPREKRGRDRFEGEKKDPLELATEEGMERYRIEVGYSHGVKPGSIVGAIANEADISSEFIGRIEIYDDFSTVDLPEGMPPEVAELLQETRVRGQRLLISKVGE